MSKTIIGITGRTGSGKSLACQWIKETIAHVEHIDCDHVGHQVLEQPEIKQRLIKHLEKASKKTTELIVPNLEQLYLTTNKNYTN